MEFKATPEIKKNIIKKLYSLQYKQTAWPKKILLTFAQIPLIVLLAAIFPLLWLLPQFAAPQWVSWTVLMVWGVILYLRTCGNFEKKAALFANQDENLLEISCDNGKLVSVKYSYIQSKMRMGHHASTRQFTYKFTIPVSEITSEHIEFAPYAIILNGNFPCTRYEGCGQEPQDASEIYTEPLEQVIIYDWFENIDLTATLKSYLHSSEFRIIDHDHTSNH